VAPNDGAHTEASKSSEQVRQGYFAARPFLFRLFRAPGTGWTGIGDARRAAMGAAHRCSAGHGTEIAQSKDANQPSANKSATRIAS
jgi:hypothetical protein